ncbi:MAG: transposase [Limnohabitans sp.]
MALGVLVDGSRDILGLCIENTKGAKSWMKVFNDLKTPGVHDNGLKGMPQALGAVFSASTLQTCIVHPIRTSLDFASRKDRKALVAAIELIYTPVSAEAAKTELNAFQAGPWGEIPDRCGRMALGLGKGDSVLCVPPGMRPLSYATSAIKSMNARLRRIIKTRGHFPCDDAATQLIWLALRNVTEGWERAANHWRSAINQLADPLRAAIHATDK